MISVDEEGVAEGLARFPDDLPLPSRFSEVPAGFYLSPRQVEAMMDGEADEWRLSAHQEERLRDLNLRAAAAKEARWKAEKLRWKEERRARKLAIWEREWELRGLKMRRPDWFMPGLNAHNLEKRRQKMELVKRCAGYLAALCGSDGYADMPKCYPEALRAVFGTACPYQSPTTMSDLRKQVFTLCRDFITARTGAAGAETTGAENPPFSGATPPRGYAGVLKRNKEKTLQRTPARRVSLNSGYSTRRASAKPEVQKGSVSAGGAPETLPLPDAPGASRGPRNIAWLPARLLPGKIVGLAVATLPKLELRHGRHGCTVAWSRGHALNFLASGLAAGRPLAGLVEAYRAALGREDHGTQRPGREQRSPGRVIARARRAAYRLGIVAQWALDAYRERRDAKREGRERCRDFEAVAVAKARDENERMIDAAKAAVNSPDFDERARARRFLDGLGIAF